MDFPFGFLCPKRLLLLKEKHILLAQFCLERSKFLCTYETKTTICVSRIMLYMYSLKMKLFISNVYAVSRKSSALPVNSKGMKLIQCVYPFWQHYKLGAFGYGFTE